MNSENKKLTEGLGVVVAFTALAILIAVLSGNGFISISRAETQVDYRQMRNDINGVSVIVDRSDPQGTLDKFEVTQYCRNLGPKDIQLVNPRISFECEALQIGFVFVDDVVGQDEQAITQEEFLHRVAAKYPGHPADIAETGALLKASYNWPTGIPDRDVHYVVFGEHIKSLKSTRMVKEFVLTLGFTADVKHPGKGKWLSGIVDPRKMKVGLNTATAWVLDDPRQIAQR